MGRTEEDGEIPLHTLPIREAQRITCSPFFCPFRIVAERGARFVERPADRVNQIIIKIKVVLVLHFRAFYNVVITLWLRWRFKHLE